MTTATEMTMTMPIPPALTKPFTKEQADAAKAKLLKVSSDTKQSLIVRVLAAAMTPLVDAATSATAEDAPAEDHRPEDGSAKADTDRER